ncbi:MAG: serine protease [Reyranellaceae bacterium]
MNLRSLIDDNGFFLATEDEKLRNALWRFVGEYAVSAAYELAADFRADFPFGPGADIRVKIFPTHIVCSFAFAPYGQMPFVGTFTDDEIERLGLANPQITHDLLTGSNANSRDLVNEYTVTVSSAKLNGRYSVHGPIVQIRRWVQGVLLPILQERNRKRVAAVIPPPPTYSINAIVSALWVLECDTDVRQGSAFALEGFGLVTCDHVLGSYTHAFQSNDPSKRYPVRVTRLHQVIDLAVLEIDAPPLSVLSAAPEREVLLHEHVLIAGHPNFRLGDSPQLSPGLIVGFRTVSSIRRMITNAAIVAGTSGGPVLDAGGKVIGVAVTGARSLSSSRETEDHAIIPIWSLALM